MDDNINYTFFTRPTKEIPSLLSGNSYTFIYFTAKEHLTGVLQMKKEYDKKRLPPVPILPVLIKNK